MEIILLAEILADFFTWIWKIRIELEQKTDSINKLSTYDESHF